MSDIQSVRSFNSHLPSKIIYIDSRDATQYLQTDITSYFKYSLTEKIEVPDNQVVFISLNSTTIPYSFYNIREDVNDKVDIKVGIWNGSVITSPGTKTITIPAGNYSANTLSNEFKDLVNATTLDTQTYI